MQSPLHVFISFKTEERMYAFQLKTALNQAGFEVWWQEEIQCGQEWHGEIDKAIEEAGAIVVLWSRKSMLSPWVRHEASQAIVKSVYSPVRIEVFEIDSPYNRVQATDIINWSGDINHPGFQNLLVRLEELMPKPIPFWKQSITFVWKQISLIVLSMIAIIALLLLFKQSRDLKEQIETHNETFLNIKKQSTVLEKQGTALQSQLEKQDELIKKSDNQSKVLQQQLEQQDKIFLNAQTQIEVLQTQTQTQEKIFSSVRKILQPIQNFKVSVYVDIDSSIPGVKKYLSYLKDNLIDKGNKLRKDLPEGVYISIGHDENDAQELSILNNSHLWPSMEDSSYLFDVVNYIDISLNFRTPDNINENSDDLIIEVKSYGDDAYKYDPYKSSLNWNIKSNTLRISFTDIPNPEYWKSTSKIASIPDIEMAIISARFLSIMVPDLYDKNAINAVLKSRAGLHISSLFINYSGRTILIRGSDMKDEIDTNGLHKYTTLVSKGERF